MPWYVNVDFCVAVSMSEGWEIKKPLLHWRGEETTKREGACCFVVCESGLDVMFPDKGVNVSYCCFKLEFIVR